MILEKIQLEPFAGFTRKELDFAPGLNVVLGPNDVGKSSLFRAVDGAFFLPAKVRANTVEGKGLRRLIPLGGDQATVRLRFTAGGGRYELQKTWGANFGARLTLPDGNVLNAPEAVEARLLELLPAPPATFQSVLLIPQNTLERTKEELEKKPESLHSLGDALRRALELAGGVSVEKMKAELTRRLEEALSNWDVLAGGPKGLRGIENPWQKSVGSVLKAFYRREELRRKLAETQALEGDLGDKLRALGEKQARLEEARAFLRKNQGIVDGVAERARLELERKAAERELQELTRDFGSWTQAESDRRLLEGEVARLEERKKAVELEWKGVRAAADRKNFVARFEKLLAARERRNEAERALAALPALKTDDIKKINQLAAAVAQARAGRIRVQFTARRKLDLQVRKNDDPPRSGTLEAGGSLSVQSGGRVQIGSELFELTVTAGEGRTDQGEAAALAALLEKLQCKTPEEAQEKHERWLAAQAAQREAEALYKALLGKDDFTALQKLWADAQAGAVARDPEQVEKEFQEVSAQYTDKRGALAVAQRLLAELARRYGVTEPAALARMLGKRTADAESAAARIGALPQLPPEITDSAAFVQEFRAAQNALPALAEEVRVISNAVADLKARLPESSAQEYDRLHREASEEFQSELRRAKALLRVQEEVEKFERASGDIYRDFRAGFDRFVRELSAGRYAQARMLDSIPSEFRRQDGVEIPFEWLSAGTKDAFALALRLSMARHFLGEARGFLLIDDPMVAMDPARQRAVAELLRAFADRAQVVVFTCHPAHAELLGGNRIELTD